MSFLLLARVGFPKSVAEIIWSTYSENTVKIIRKLEKLNCGLRKALNLWFLCKCDDGNVIPIFLNFYLANSHLEYLSTYRLSQSNILSEEIYQKKSTVRVLRKKINSLKMSLQNEFDLIYFAHVSTLFFGINDKILKSKRLVQKKKVYKFLQESKTENDPEVIFNFSKYAHSDIEKKLFATGLSFCRPPEQLTYGDCLVRWFVL